MPTWAETGRPEEGWLARALWAAAWSFGYGALGLFWALGAPGFPFGRTNDPSAALSVFREARADVGGPVIAALGLLGVVVAVAMTRPRGRGFLSSALVGFAWVLAGGLILVVPDYRPLLSVAYAPIVLVGELFNWPPDVSLRDVLPWPVFNQVLCMAGGVVWAGAAVAYRRETRGACARCGRSDEPAHWTAPESAARWGKWVTFVAVAVPLLYAVTRYAWALGIPVGITEEFLREGQAIGLWWAGAALATLAVGGALLTLGLIRPWGETFPRWIPIIEGRRVPPRLAIIPASLVSVLVTSAGLMFIRLVMTGGLTETFAFAEEVGWVALAPELLWPLWGAALAAATLAYHYRRRSRCEHCGRL
ncbi:MAG TPA: hypothetical protein VF148_04930 [Acidimicrobiia bacterium]